MLTENEYEADLKRLKVILNAPIPINITEVKSVLGMMLFYSSFIKNVTIIALPLNDLTKMEC